MPASTSLESLHATRSKKRDADAGARAREEGDRSAKRKH